jgi:hypothetical protein
VRGSPGPLGVDHKLRRNIRNCLICRCADAPLATRQSIIPVGSIAGARLVRHDDPMTEDLDVLLAHIVANPTDEALPEDYAVDSYPLSLREGDLIRGHGRRWAAIIDQFVSGWSFRRGFAEVISVDAEWFLESAEDLYRMVPILHVDFTDAHLVAEDLFASPHLERLLSIGLLRNDLGDAEIAHLAASPYLGNLQWLKLSDNRVGPAGLEALAASELLPRLGYVNLDFNPVPDPTPRFCDGYDATSAVGEELQERYGHREWLDAHPRSPWPPDRDAVW